jgi:hypothetical protein
MPLMSQLISAQALDQGDSVTRFDQIKIVPLPPVVANQP